MALMITDIKTHTVTANTTPGVIPIPVSDRDEFDDIISYTFASGRTNTIKLQKVGDGEDSSEFYQLTSDDGLVTTDDFSAQDAPRYLWSATSEDIIVTVNRKRSV